jgi:hypothetical protein
MAAAQAKGEGVSAGDPGTPLVFVVVAPPYQVAHHGQTFGPLEIAQVPDNVAAHWITCGWAVAK